jgi:uncharacterized protein
MRGSQAVALGLVIVGALNWGLVAIAEFDLVAWLFGEEFGSTTAASRVVYGLVGLAGVYLLATVLAARRSTGNDRGPAPRSERPDPIATATGDSA